MAGYNELLALCAADISFWRGKGFLYQDYISEINRLNVDNPEVFLFRFQRGQVSVLDKPPSDTATYFLGLRVRPYLRFLGDVAAKFLPDLSMDIAVNLGDCAKQNDWAPIFSFQKQIGDSLLLLPDIDFLVLNFYDSMSLFDDLDFDLKLKEAIFVGSTTGVDPRSGNSVLNTRFSVDHAPSERIRAAKYFDGHYRVTFKLPSVVQCDSVETEDYIKSFDFAKGGAISWDSQYKFRYLISLDGNGATCSRVALTLKSGSLLLKYESKNVLYYFGALVPWVHYIPISDDSWVDYALNFCEDRRGFSSNISRAATDFSEKYLNKVDVHRYAAVLLNELASLCFSSDASAERGKLIDSSSSDFDISVHVQHEGDIWCWPLNVGGTQGSGHAIEGFSINGAGDFKGRWLEYQCRYGDGEVSGWMPAGVMCGGRGQNRFISGFRIRLIASESAMPLLKYKGTFVDGSAGDWMEQGRWCSHDSNFGLESFELHAIWP